MVAELPGILPLPAGDVVASEIMAKHRARKTVSPAVARAEAWFGVTHAVPPRGSKAHASMMRKYSAKHGKARKNPVDPEARARLSDVEHKIGDMDNKLTRARGRVAALMSIQRRGAPRKNPTKHRAVYEFQIMDGADWHIASVGSQPAMKRLAKIFEKGTYVRVRRGTAASKANKKYAHYARTASKLPPGAVLGSMGQIYGKVRRNPWNAERKAWITREGEPRHPQNCPIPLAASMLAERREQGKRGEKKIARFANCDYRSGEIAMHYKPKDAGSTFSGRVRRGKHKDADWVTHSVNEKTGAMVDLSFYKHAGEIATKPGLIERAGKLLDWWPGNQ